MTAPELVAAPVGAKVTASGDMNHLCPFKDEVDKGRATVSWTTNGATYELHSLAEYFGSFAEEKISHEQLATRVMNELNQPGVSELRVEVRYVTAGLIVEVVRAVHGEPLRG